VNYYSEARKQIKETMVNSSTQKTQDYYSMENKLAKVC
jgi:hypothetical protein